MIQGPDPKEALAYIFDHTGWVQKIETLIIHGGGTKEEAEDIFWDAWEKFEKQVREGDWSGGNLLAYLKKIAWNMWLKYLERDKPKMPIATTDISILEVDNRMLEVEKNESRERMRWKKIAEDPTTMELVRAYYDSMGKNCFEIIFLEKEGLSQSDIAKKLGWGGPERVKTERSRCKQRMKNHPERKKALEDYLENFD